MLWYIENILMSPLLDNIVPCPKLICVYALSPMQGLHIPHHAQ